ISNGPSDSNSTLLESSFNDFNPLIETDLLETTVTLASVLIPCILAILASCILKVNKEGTGGIMACPKSSRSFQILGLLPVAISNFFVRYVFRRDTTSQPPPGTPGPDLIGTRSITELFLKTCIPKRSASPTKQSITVWEELDRGNMRPSCSIFRGIPLSSKKATVSCEP